MTDAPVPTLTRSFHVEVELGPLEDHGMTRVGHRRVVPIVGGTVSGELEGVLLPGGADWQIVRPDGAIEVDATYTARTSTGGFVLIHARGLRSGPPEVLEALLRGEQVSSDAYTFRTAVTLESSDPELAWTQQSLFLASAVRGADTVSYTAYRVG
ncbi:DUF3237 family protein [Demequina zhanjiangensis]|uniref:UPF0311 protein QQX04_13445 n=1 Tax=Demequina zhanjiangensis TaxID=3051659 RepID=A0ABT8G4C9_9MICO|nr:DUF3237 family protein [Demequina sp. SYSU T00b26]MDN4473999.1 DUF3237 family protein [Demequina sp. SYSU T00b26]